MKWGIIGTGNMGSMLVKAFIESSAVAADDMMVFNRSKEKPELLKRKYPNVTIAKSTTHIADTCNIIFICVKPDNFQSVLKQLQGSLKAHHCLVSITSPVAVEDLELITPCQVSRIVPSITNHALSGVSLFTIGSRVSNEYKDELYKAFQQFSNPVPIEESYIRAASDIVSCGPAFLSFLLKEWVKAAHQVTEIPEEKATELTESMVIGLGALFSQKIFSLDELMEKVTVKGGVTGEGIKALEANIDGLFTELFEATQRKHWKDKKEIKL